MRSTLRVVLVLVSLFSVPVLSAKSWIIPGVANTAGANGTFFATDLSMTNPTGSFATVHLRFIPSAGGTPRSEQVSLNPGQTVTYHANVR